MQAYLNANLRPPVNAEIAAQITVVSSLRGHMCKKFGLDEHRRLTTAASANLWEGTFHRQPVASLDEFLFLRSVFGSDPSCCFTYGVPKSEAGLLVTKDERPRAPGSIARCRADLAFSEGKPGVLFFDHDPHKAPDAKRWDWFELDNVLCEALPDLRGTRRAWLPSSSAFINRESDGAELKGIGGWRLYVLIDDASAIPRTIDYIVQRLWELGRGFIEISKGGAALDRTLIDGSTGTPERVDFIADPLLGPGVVRRVPGEFPVLLGTKPMLASATVPLAEPMADWRRNNAKVREAKAEAKPLLETERTEIIERKLPEFRERNPGVAPEELRREIRAAMESGALGLDFVLHTPDGDSITVKDLLAARELLDGMELRDPLEPDYDGGRQVAKFYYNSESNSATIHSFAHGPRTFDLSQSLRELRAEDELKKVRLPEPSLTAGCPIASAPMPSAGLNTRSLAEVEPENLDWMWEGRLVRNKLNIIAGPPGLGKSQLLAAIAAAITTAGAWPDGGCCRQGGVLLIQAEDGVADTVVPRHRAAGARMDRIRTAALVAEGSSQRLMQLDKDLSEIEMTLAQFPWIDTLILDPVTGFFGRADSHKDAEVRGVLEPLSEFAERRRVTVIGVAHLNKGANARSAGDRIAGSAAFLQVPRMAHMVVTDPDDDTLRVFQPFKHNVSRPREGLAFRIEGCLVRHREKEIQTSRVAWADTKTLDLHEALNGKRNGEHPTRLDEAMQYLQAALRQGTKAQLILEKEAAEQGIKGPTLRRAKKELNVRSLPSGGSWTWSLANTQALALPAGIQLPRLH